MSRSRVLLLLALSAAAVAAAQSSAGGSEGPAEGAAEGAAEEPTAWVEQGRLRGVHIHRGPGSTLRSFYAFLGVPYAQPPVGQLRFKDPRKAKPWTGTRNATAYGSSCIQMPQDSATVSGDEDCLFLNVFTADPPKLWGSVRRFVLVLIHGGGFIGGSGDMEVWRPDPLLQKKLVVVSMNYRLGVFGFLNTGDSQAPGNAGLKDQAMAFRWVQRNIAAFGGDPSKVTIMGQSAGAACVQYHMLSPLSRGLFRGAIAISGNALSTWARVEQPRRNAEALRRLFPDACPADAPHDLVRCLQPLNASELVAKQYNVSRRQATTATEQSETPFFERYFLKNFFLPSVEAPGSSNAPFLTEEPEHLLQEGRFAKVPYMTGHTNGEAILFLSPGSPLQDPSRWAEVDEHFADIFRWEMPAGMRTPEKALRMRRFYLGDRSLRNASQDLETLELFVQMCTDLFFAVGSLNSARMMADCGATVFDYEFSRDGPIGFTKILVLNASHIPGVAHGGDMAYLFNFTMPGVGNDAESLPIPDSEVPIRERQVNIFTNMIEVGNPTPAGSDLPRWPPFQGPEWYYVDMGEALRVLSSADSPRAAFWRQLEADSGHIRPRRCPRAGRTPATW